MRVYPHIMLDGPAPTLHGDWTRVFGCSFEVLQRIRDQDAVLVTCLKHDEHCGFDIFTITLKGYHKSTNRLVFFRSIR